MLLLEGLMVNSAAISNIADGVTIVAWCDGGRAVIATDNNGSWWKWN